MFDRLKQDLRYSLRTLASRPVFAITAALTLALGIGVNVAVFAVVETLVLRPLPYANASQLVAINNLHPLKEDDGHGTTVPDYLDERDQAKSLANAALYQYTSFSLLTAGAATRLIGLRATPSLFATLGTQPALGRALIDDDAQPGNDKVVVLSQRTWRENFASDPAVIGRDINLDGSLHRVVGVMPTGFFFPESDAQVWTPYTILPEQREDKERGYSAINAIGLLKPDASVASLETEFRAITARNAARSTALRDDYAQTGFTTRATLLADAWLGSLRKTLWLLQGMAVLVLLITVFNVTNLLLARDASRRHEFALRAALGAGRRRLDRQIAIDIGVLVTLGGLAGMLVAGASLPLLDRLGLSLAWSWYDIEPRIGLSATIFSLALTIALALLLAASTIFSSRRGSGFGALQSSSRVSASVTAVRARQGLVIAQFALTLVLLVSAGLLIKSFIRLQQTNPGFDSKNLLSLRLRLSEESHADDADAARYYERLLAVLRSTPGVDGAAYTSSLPFDGHTGTSDFKAERYAGDDAGRLIAERQSVDEGYFATMGIALLEGRAFNEGDTAAATPVVIIDETLAHHLWPERSALGHRLSVEDDGSSPMTIVGVVRAVHQNSLAEHAELDAMYWPYRQVPARFGELVVKSVLPAAVMIPAVRAAALTVDAQLPLYDAQTMDERVAHSLDEHRTPMLLLGAFAALALLLAAIGLYGVIAFLTSQRTAELGVRIAVGASSRQVLALVMRSGLRLCMAGIAVGALGAFMAGRLLSAQLFEVNAADPVVFAGVAMVLLLVALFACWLPAFRATRIDPATALREQ